MPSSRSSSSRSEIITALPLSQASGTLNCRRSNRLWKMQSPPRQRTKSLVPCVVWQRIETERRYARRAACAPQPNRPVGHDQLPRTACAGEYVSTRANSTPAVLIGVRRRPRPPVSTEILPSRPRRLDHPSSDAGWKGLPSQNRAADTSLCRHSRTRSNQTDCADAFVMSATVRRACGHVTIGLVQRLPTTRLDHHLIRETKPSITTSRGRHSPVRPELAKTASTLRMEKRALVEDAGSHARSATYPSATVKSFPRTCTSPSGPRVYQPRGPIPFGRACSDDRSRHTKLPPTPPHWISRSRPWGGCLTG
jgi:hypothetical protein